MYMSDTMGASLDRWITGNYGEDAYGNEEFCHTCINYENGFCNRHNKDVFEEEWCADWEEDILYD
jgi:hypothetical protein